MPLAIGFWLGFAACTVYVDSVIHGEAKLMAKS